MDINYLLLREQIERVRADRAACRNARDAHDAMAKAYRGLIADYRSYGAGARGARPEFRLMAR